MSTLLQLVKTSNEITETLYESGGELTPQLEDNLKQLEVSLEAKVDAYVAIIERSDKEIEFLEHKIKQLQSVKKGLSTLKDHLKDRLKLASRELEKPVLEGIESKVTVSPSKPSVIIADESQLTDKYLEKVVTYKPLKDIILTDLNQGIEVPGVKLEQGYSLRIGVKNKQLKG